MTELLTLTQTLEAIAACSDDGQVWARHAWVHASDGDARQARFWLAGHDAEEDADGVHPFAAAHGLTHYLEGATFADVLSVQKRQQPFSIVDDYARALDHYSEEDAFLERPGLSMAYGDAPQEELARARAEGLSPGLYAAFDLTLETVEPAQRKAAASLVAEVQALSVGEALAQVRALPLAVACNIDRAASDHLQARFAAIGLALQVTRYRSFPWQPIG
ncbi:DUF7716 domain-containing protein [Stenotrophomonas rhizophila]|uniref:DUF7716 domain-containing protein n=1 Tax=Stenotrophomonas rhizophila TaxID=216778 RepID=UPI0028D17A87|nr:hypothetical protein [Stenotrophomonas rhizophila]